MYPATSEDFYESANARRATGDLDGAIADYSEAIRLKPDYAAYDNRGNTWLAKGDLEAAEADYSEAIRLKPGYSAAYNNRAIARTMQGNYKAAIADYNEAIRLNPDLGGYYNNRAELWFVRGKFAQALADFSMAITVEPDILIARVGQAVTQHALGQVDEARMQWAVLVREDARFMDAHWVADEFYWPSKLAAEAGRLIRGLKRAQREAGR